MRFESLLERHEGGELSQAEAAERLGMIGEDERGLGEVADFGLYLERQRYFFGGDVG